MQYAGLAEKPEIPKNKRISILKIEHQKKKKETAMKVDIQVWGGFVHFCLLIELLKIFSEML